jgi:ketosteroid isomerase-like protein
LPRYLLKEGDKRGDGISNEAAFIERWQAFLIAYRRGDDDAALEAYRAWQEVWAPLFHDDFSAFERVFEAAYEPDVEVVEDSDIGPDPLSGHGLAAFADLRGEERDAFATIRYEVQELRRCDPNRFLILARHRTRMHGTGLEFDSSSGMIFTLRGDRIMRWESYGDHARALEAAGIA